MEAKTILFLLVTVCGPNWTIAGFLGERREFRDLEVCLAHQVGLICASNSTYILCQHETMLGKGSCPTGYICNPELNQCYDPTGSITTTTTTTTPIPPPPPLCTSEGFFPDPSNCQNYYFCDSANQIMQFTCPAHYVWDPLTFHCKEQLFPEDCVLMECLGQYQFIVNQRNPHYYGFCSIEGAPAVFKCQSDYSFVKESMSCEFVCQHEGYFADRTPDSYYICSQDEFGLTSTRFTCPTSYVFDMGLEYCIKPVPGCTCSN